MCKKFSTAERKGQVVAAVEVFCDAQQRSRRHHVSVKKEVGVGGVLEGKLTTGLSRYSVSVHPG